MKRSPLPPGFRFLNVSPAVRAEVATDYFSLEREAEERVKCEDNLHAKLHGVQRLLKLQIWRGACGLG